MRGRPERYASPQMYEGQCRGKRQFKSPKAARAALRVALADGADATLQWYRCKACRNFHLGRQSRGT